MLDAVTRLAGGPALDPAAMMQELTASDPRMAMLMQMMQGQRGGPSKDTTPDDRDDLIADLSGRLEATEARLTKMTRIARQLHEQMRTASQRLSQLAAALGACGLCWGEDPGCLGCRGRGRPGMIRCDPDTRAALFGARSPLPDAGKHSH